MATTVPPPASAPPPLPPPPRRANTTRIVAVAAIAVVVAIVLVLLLAGSGSATYYLIFPEAGQLVRGDQVQVGGVPVGSIKDITLLHDYDVRITINVESSLAPLHEGTTAEIRVPSLSSVANRYIALSPGPNNKPSLPSGSTLPITSTHGVVDLDQLFGIFNAKTRKGLQQLIQGSAEQYSGVAPQLQKDAKYFPPALAAFDHVLAEFGGDQEVFSNFLVESAKTTTVLAGRSQQLTELVSHADTAFGAIASQQSNLTAGLKAIPATFREGNRTFETLPTTLADLTKLVDATKPAAPLLGPYVSKLQPLVSTATPVVSDFSEAISKPGASNDLTEAALALPKIATTLVTASPDNVRALEESVPITALFGPYTPDLEGFLRAFGQTSAYYDANGHYARVAGLFPDFELGAENTLKPTNPSQVVQGLKTGQLRRCPGAATQPAADGSSPFSDNGQLGCDPSEVP
ncbi:MAG TPA: MlaD family protein [Solirubrobacteraceae bacterium]|jgi:phospholipid/cholesterol/gamma-HCH transport system substrate-binding protein|nr:MlaD family protein [Solirubrobacteraceae bacterium]